MIKGPNFDFPTFLPKHSQQPNTALRKLIPATLTISGLKPTKNPMIKGPNFDIPTFPPKHSQQLNTALRKLILSTFSINGFQTKKKIP
jgi:ribosomal protein S12